MSNDVGWYGTYIAAAGWLASLTTSDQSRIPRTQSESSEDTNNLDAQTANEHRHFLDQITHRLDDAPKNRAELLVSRGMYYGAIENWDAAITDLNAALAIKPDDNGEAYLHRGATLLQSGHPVEALSDFEISITQFLADSSEVENLNHALEWQIRTLIQLERFEDAIAKCEEALNLPTNRELTIRMQRGIALTGMGRNDDAVNELNFIVETLGDKTDQDILGRTLVARAEAYLKLDIIDKAVSDIERAQAIDGLTFSNLHLMAQSEILRDDYRAALNCYEKIIAIAPNHADGFAQLAVIQACCPNDTHRNGDRAEENARTACELSKWNDWTHISILAAAKAEQGDFNQAIELAEWSLRIAPDSEKQDRQKRIDQFRDGEPFRIGNARPRTIYRRSSSES